MDKSALVIKLNPQRSVVQTLDGSTSETIYQNQILKGSRKEMFQLTMHSTHFIYGYMGSGIW